MRSYLEELAASQIRVQETSKEFQQVLSQVSQSNLTAQIEKVAWERDWDRISARLAKERSRLAGLSVPEAAIDLNCAVIEQYGILMETVEATRPLVFVASQLSQANLRAERDPATAERITQEMRSVEARRKDVARQIEELNSRSLSCEDRISEQQEKLQIEFGIAMQSEKRSAATGR